MTRPVLPLIVLTVALAATSIVPRAEAAGLKGYQRQLLRLHNVERKKRNRPPLRISGILNRSSVRYATLMAAQPGSFLDHTGPDDSTMVDRILAAGGRNLRTMGENIALGQRTPREVTRAWMRSRGHRVNILNKRFRLVGFGKAGSLPHWVTNFGG